VGWSPVNTTEVRTLLREAAGLDRWLGATDPESGQMMVAGWSAMLEPVPLDFARRAVRDHYAQPDARTLTPGELLHTWRQHRDRERRQSEAVARAAEQTAVSVQQVLDAGEGPAVVFGSGREYLADMMAVVAQGGDPSTVTRPAGVRVRVLSPEAEARERACRFPDICVCTHLECRDGWLDAETTRRSVLGQDCLQATRCPQCNDGLLMAVEKGVARKPRRTAGAR
jgi:hypothetical protein